MASQDSSQDSQGNNQSGLCQLTTTPAFSGVNLLTENERVTSQCLKNENSLNRLGESIHWEGPKPGKNRPSKSTLCV